MREGHGVFGVEHSFITRKRDKMNGGGMETGDRFKGDGERETMKLNLCQLKH